MGSPLRATVVGAAAGPARRAWRELTADLELTEATLSRFRESSDLSWLNRRAGDGGWWAAPPRLYAMLATAARAWRRTGGSFDARVLVALEALGERGGVPLPKAAARATSGGPCGIERAPRDRRVRLAQPVDSGGIGKGLGLRWAHRAARRALPRATGLLIEAGGDLVVSGPDARGGGWRIGIEDPRADGEPVAVLELAQGAVATSSIAVRQWRAPDGRRVHHLIDPRTGRPGGDGLLAVTVALADPAWAEIWSKALFLAGPAAIGGTARAHGLAAWWVRADGAVEMTPAARALTIWERPLIRSASA
jgi:FAD:protein FMN transferase